MPGALDIYVTVSGQEIGIRADPSDNAPAEPFLPPIDLTKLTRGNDTLADMIGATIAKLIREGLLNVNNTDLERARKFGEILFTSLFHDTGPGWRIYRARAAMTEAGRPLRTRLLLPAELSALPWELLWDTIDDLWLAVDARRTLVRTPDRCAALPDNYSNRSDPLKIVVVAPSPLDNSLLDPTIEEEITEHITRLKHCFAYIAHAEQIVEVEIIRGANTLKSLSERLIQAEPIHVLHIFCYGDWIEEEIARLFLDDQHQRSARLHVLLRDRHKNNQNGRIQLVVLNARSSMIGRTSVNNLAASLVQDGVPAAIAMQCKIDSKIIERATGVLYRALITSTSVDRAINKVRSHLFENYASSMDWSMPVLFLHPQAKDLYLFDQSKIRTLNYSGTEEGATHHYVDTALTSPAVKVSRSKPVSSPPVVREPRPSRRLSVFLCHSSRDKPTVRNLYKKLLDDGLDPWLDEKKILAGQDWEFEIGKAVRNADVVVVCLSNSAVTKGGYIHKEIKDALDVAYQQPEGKIFIIPLRLEACDVPERLKRLQWVDYFGNRGKGYKKLLSTLEMRANDLDLPVKNT